MVIASNCTYTIQNKGVSGKELESFKLEKTGGGLVRVGKYKRCIASGLPSKISYK